MLGKRGKLLPNFCLFPAETAMVSTASMESRPNRFSTARSKALEILDGWTGFARHKGVLAPWIHRNVMAQTPNFLDIISKNAKYLKYITICVSDNGFHFVNKIFESQQTFRKRFFFFKKLSDLHKDIDKKRNG